MLASILEKSISTTRFRVDDVVTNSKRLPLSNTKFNLGQRTGQPLVAFSHEDTFKTILSGEIHPLTWAVHLAFAEHRPLCLTPDMLWIAIAQGFAQHVNNNSEQLRDQFVHHQDKEKLIVEAQELSEPEHWAKAVQAWGLQIRDHVGAEVYRLIECNFTTTTPIIQTVSRIVMMDTFQQYFDYELRMICGIPEVIFAGTVEDWQEIYHRVLQLAKYDLNWWVDRLLPICQEWIKTAKGQPSLEFWRAVYMPEEAYGSNLITGWLGDLFPYLREDTAQAPTLKNSLLSRKRHQFIVKEGVSLERLPSGLSQVPLLLKNGQAEIPLQLLGGFIGVKQESDSGILQPELGWAVQDQSGIYIPPEVLVHLQKEHTTCTPINWSKASLDLNLIPKEMIQILEQFDGATLYANSSHPWQLRQFNQHQLCKLGYEYLTAKAKVFIDLVDERYLAYLNLNNVLWILLCKIQPFTDRELSSETYFEWNEANQSLGNVTDCVIIAKGLAQFFERMLQADGYYYFDYPDFVADEKLEHIPEVCRAIACDTKTPSAVLEKLSRDESAEVRDGVAQNRSTPPNLLDQLADDPSTGVRELVAAHMNTSSAILLHLANDPVRSIHIRLLERRDLPSNVLEHLAHNADPIVRELVAGHANTPAHCLQQLAEDADPKVQDALVSVPGLPANHPWLQRIRQGECSYCKKANQNRRKCLYFYEGKRCPD